jgi:hypothetical protein
MTDHEQPTPENRPLDDAELKDVDALGGDSEILRSLPEHGQPENVPFEDGELPEIEQGDDPLVGIPPSSVQPLDIEAALAAVASLDAVMTEHEAAEQAALRNRQEAEAARLRAEREAEETAAREESERIRRVTPVLHSPPPLTLRRGQLASVVPALALMGIGGWLIIGLTTPGALPINPPLVAGVAAAALVLVLLAQWLSFGRWQRGTLFLALAAGGCAVVLYGMTQPGGLLPGRAWPLFIVALGGAFLLAGLFSRPFERRVLLPGILLLAGGGVGLAASAGLLPDSFLRTAAQAWPVVVALLVLLWVLPLVRRRG